MKAKQETYVVGGLRGLSDQTYTARYDFRDVLEYVDYGQATLVSIKDQIVSGSELLGRRLNSTRLAATVYADYYKCE